MEVKNIVFFDGVCNLCNESVQTILKYDKKNRYVFAPLQGETAKKLLSEFIKKNPGTDSIILWSNENISTKSSAVLKIARYLAFPLNLAYGLMIVPVFIRNYVYGIIAKNRYRWFGKKEECWLPTPELKSKFLP